MMEATSRSRHGTRFLHGKHCWLSPVSHIALRRGGEERAQEDRGTQAPLSAPALGGFWRRLHLRGAGTPPALLERVVPPQLSPPGPGVPVSRSQTPWPPPCVLGLWSQAAWQGWGDRSRDPSRPPPAAALGLLGRTLLPALLSATLPSYEALPSARLSGHTGAPLPADVCAHTQNQASR